MSYIIHYGVCDIYLRDKLQALWQIRRDKCTHLFFIFLLQFTGLVISQLFDKTCLVKPLAAICVDITITQFHFSKINVEIFFLV